MTIYNALRGRTRYPGAINSSIFPASRLLTGTATAVSSFAGYPQSNVLDGNDGTLWACGTTPVAGKWIYVDFGSAKHITRYVLRQYQMVTGYYATSFKAQKSDDTTTWIDIDIVTSAEQINTRTLIETHLCQYVRFLAVEGGYQQWQIATIEIYGY